MPPTKSTKKAKPEAEATEPAAEAAASPATPAPARKPRARKAQEPAGESAAPAVAAEPAAEAEPAAAPTAEAEAAAPPAEDLVRRDVFARMIGFRPAELVTFERKGWLRPAGREDGMSLYRKSEAQEIRQDLRRRLHEEADLTRRNRRY